MSLRIRGLIVAAAVAVGGAVSHRRLDATRVCSMQDEVAYARMTTRTCEINWNVKNRTKWEGGYQEVGSCWKMRVYNTDMFMSSTIFQNEEDGRCALSISGYHGAIAGYARAAVSLATPFELWSMCNNEMYAPYVRLLRHHTTLGNWSKIANFLGGADSTCKGDLVLAAESMGGSAGEILAACANMGSIHELQDKSLPSFHINAFYTFGTPAASKHPIKNVLRSDGCFGGKRIFYNTDAIGHIGVLTKNLTHSMMDALEIFQTPKGPTFRVTPCGANGSMDDNRHPDPEPLDTKKRFFGKMDPANHMITGYERMLKYFSSAGFGPMISVNLVQTPLSSEYSDAMKKTIR